MRRLLEIAPLLLPLIVEPACYADAGTPEEVVDRTQAPLLAGSGLLWPTPDLGEGPFPIESAAAEHRELQVTVVARLEQPWSMAFLPDGDMLVTERAGRVRLIRDGVLDPEPVAGVPEEVQGQTTVLTRFFNLRVDVDYGGGRAVRTALLHAQPDGVVRTVIQRWTPEE